MSKLLIDERPLQCQPSLAKALGSADEAIILQQLHYWIGRTNNIQSDGQKWIYNSMTDWLKQFPWIKSRSTLSRYFDDLEKRGLVVTGNFNKAKFDKTKWYRIDYDALSDLEQRLYQNESTSDSKQDNGVTQNDATYTNRLPETTTRDDDDNARTREIDFSQTEDDPFTLASQANINVNSGYHMPIFVDFIDTLGSPVVCWAIRKTADSASHPNWSYLLTVMKNLEANGVRTVEGAEKLSERHKAENKQRYKKQNGHQHIEEPLPDWAGKEYKRPSKEFFDSLYDD